MLARIQLEELLRRLQKELQWILEHRANQNTPFARVSAPFQLESFLFLFAEQFGKSGVALEADDIFETVSVKGMFRRYRLLLRRAAHHLFDSVVPHWDRLKGRDGMAVMFTNCFVLSVHATPVVGFDHFFCKRCQALQHVTTNTEVDQCPHIICNSVSFSKVPVKSVNVSISGNIIKFREHWQHITE